MQIRVSKNDSVFGGSTRSEANKTNVSKNKNKKPKYRTSLNSFINQKQRKQSERSDLGKVKDGVWKKTDLEVGGGSDDNMGGEGVVGSELSRSTNQREGKMGGGVGFETFYWGGVVCGVVGVLWCLLISFFTKWGPSESDVA